MTPFWEPANKVALADYLEHVLHERFEFIRDSDRAWGLAEFLMDVEIPMGVLRGRGLTV